MDACYYYSGGLNFVRGRGGSEYFVWNYLDDTAALPHPGFQYWMPIPSVVAGMGMLLFRDGFRQSQIPFLILAAGFPFFVYWLGKRLSGSFRISVLAGFFSVFSGFYTIYWMNTESFLIYAWLGGLIIALSTRITSPSRWIFTLLTGVLCGLAHMTRADGILFLGLSGLLILGGRSLNGRTKAGRLLLLGVGYFFASGIWFLRNMLTWRTLFPPGTGKTLWLTEYNDLFRIPSSELTWERFFSGGLQPILAARIDAFLGNSLTTVFVLGLIFLFPLVSWGVIILRRKAETRAAVLYFLFIYLLMTIVYPFQGSRGGFLHSSAALLSMAAVAASIGLEDAIARLSRLRNWNPSSAHAVMGAGTALLALFASGTIFFHRVIGTASDGPDWASLNMEYSLGLSRLRETLTDSTRFMVNNPPCFYVTTGFQAVPVTAGTPAMLLDAVDRYGIQYVILDANVPDGLRPLYQGTVTLSRLKEVFVEEHDGMVYVWFLVLPP